MKGQEHTFDGRQLTAARALAKLTIAGLANAAGVAWMTIKRLENGGLIRVAPQSRHGYVSSETWEKIVGALEQSGVELLSAGRHHRSGVRWLSRSASHLPCGVRAY
jgi:UDP-N-acetyl-D-mannosaminuronic acid transferase (WecB/TagA/CpsF family)